MVKSIGPGLGKILLLLFGICVFALMVILTFGSLGRIFPTDLLKQASGLVLFDIGALVWIVIFVLASRGVIQRAIAFLMFVFCVVGAVAMAGADALMSGQEYVVVPQWVGQGIVYLFIGATALNLIALYFHHLNTPSLAQRIRKEAAEDRLVSEAFDLAEQRLENERKALADKISQGFYMDVLVGLGLNDIPQLPGQLPGQLPPPASAPLVFPSETLITPPPDPIQPAESPQVGSRRRSKL